MAAVDFTMGPTGLTSLTWKGTDYIWKGGAGPLLPECYGIARGNPQPVWLGNNVTSVATTVDEVTQVYDWGVVMTNYTAIQDRLMMRVTIVNNSDLTLSRYRLFPIGVKFPQKPSNTDNPHAFGKDSPAAVFIDCGSMTCALASDEVDEHVAIGLWQGVNPPNLVWNYDLFVNPGQTINPNWPSVIRPVPPGEQTTFLVSLRFGDAGATMEQLAGDVFARYRNVYPRIVKPFPRQPLARLSYNGSFRPCFLKNPRGWFNDANLDITTPSGVTAFHNTLLSVADSSIDEIKRMNAMGAILWDMEGQQLDLSYIGDPSQAEILAPELCGVFDVFVKKFRDAQIPIGFTLRPQKFSVAIGRVNVSGTQVSWVRGAKFHDYWASDREAGIIAFGTNNWKIASVTSDVGLVITNDAGSWCDIPYFYPRQANQLDVFDEMQAKVQYCNQRFGATLYYVDTDVDWYGNIDPAAVYQRLIEQYPDNIFFPEWKSPRHYAYTYPWTDSVNGYVMPNGYTLLTYPDAAGMVRVPGDGEIDAIKDQLKVAVETGGTLLFDGWYRHHANDVVKEIYDELYGKKGGKAGHKHQD